MKKEFNLDELKQYIKENKFVEGDQIYCNEYPNLIFVYELDNNKPAFIAYYADGHDLYGDGSLMELLKENKTYTFSKEPFLTWPKDIID